MRSRHVRLCAGVRVLACLSAFSVMTGCRDGSVPDRPVLDRGLCPTGGAGQNAVLADDVVLFGDGEHLRWISTTSWRIYELPDDSLRPLEIGPARAFYTTVWDERYWYRAECSPDCVSIEESPIFSVVRIDRLNGSREVLGRTPSVHGILPFRRSVYWGTWGARGEGAHRVWRANPGTGTGPSGISPVDKGAIADPVIGLHGYQGKGILIAGIKSVAWVSTVDGDGAGERAVELFWADTIVGDAAYQDGVVFVLERGQRHGQDVSPLGALFRVSVTGGSVRKLMGKLREPSSVIVNGQSVYVMLSESPEIVRIAIEGGNEKTVFRGKRYDLDQGEETLGMWSHQCGIVWLHGNSCPGCPGTLEIVPWEVLRQ